jgi:uncharacterized membrane protein YvlD (DUF360 family)
MIFNINIESFITALLCAIVYKFFSELIVYLFNEHWEKHHPGEG